MSTSLALRAAQRCETHTLATIRRHAILSLVAADMGSERAREWADSSGDERVHHAITQHEVWVAERDGAAVGWVELDRDRVEGFYVHPDVAGGGIGSLLWAHAEGRIRAAGHHTVGLEASWNAEPFDLRRGYQAFGRETGGRGPSLAEAAGRPRRARGRWANCRKDAEEKPKGR